MRYAPPLFVRLLRLRHTLTSVLHQTEWEAVTPALVDRIKIALAELEAIIQQEREE